MIKLTKLIKELKKEPKKDMRVTLDYLKSIQSDEPFNTRQPLYHLVLRPRLDSVMKKGLVPSQPESSTHGGSLKGEMFKGVWLASEGDAAWIVDIHMLPREYEYSGVVLEIDGSKLDPKLFNIGIEMDMRLLSKTKQGEKISRNEYYKNTQEIVYLGVIPPSAITVLD
jgi:hypothetical protein